MTILFMCFASISGTFALDLEDLSFGQKFEFQFPSVWVSDTSVDDCIHECQARASCSHVNYFRTAHLCEIDVSPPTLDVISVTSPGVVSWKKPSDIQVCTFNTIICIILFLAWRCVVYKSNAFSYQYLCNLHTFHVSPRLIEVILYSHINYQVNIIYGKKGQIWGSIWIHYGHPMWTHIRFAKEHYTIVHLHVSSPYY